MMNTLDTFEPTASANAADAPVVAPEPAARNQPLSYTQESLWLLDQMSDRESPAYNESLAFRIDGALEVEHLREALRLVVLRHDTLRTRFAEVDGQLRAIVHEDARVTLETPDLRSDAEPEQAAQALIDAAGRQPFDLREGPLLRAVLARVGDSAWVLGLTAHHIIVDGWSLGLILDELSKHYLSLSRFKRPAQLPELELRYGDYVRQQRDAFERGEFDDKLDYWKRSLAEGPELLRLPTDRPRPARQGFRGEVRSVRIARERIAALTDRAQRECGSTQFNVLLAAYATLLHRYCAQERIRIGTTVLNRDDVDQLALVGCFVNTAALNFDFAPGQSFRDLLLRTGEAAIGLFEHQDAPYPKVLERLALSRDPSHNPVFQTMMTALGSRRMLNLGADIVSRHYRVGRSAAKFDLLLYAIEHEGFIEFETEFNTELFDADTIERLLSHYLHLLDQLAQDIDVEIERVTILPDPERLRILESFNDTRVDYPAGDVLSWFEAQAARAPDAIAVEFEDRSLTYAELDRTCNRVARQLQGRAEGGSGFVGVYMERSIEMVVALVSIMKAGLAYVPIDPDYPADRVRYMIENSRVPLVLTQPRHLPALAELGANALTLDDLSADDASEQPLARTLSADSRAYMIYTSGSTGRPKGVINRHGALFNRLYWMQQAYRLGGDDRILQKTPFSFDVSVWEFFWPLMFGARIVLAAPGGHRDTDYLKRFIRERAITTLHFVPSMLNVFLEEDELAAHCASVRRVFCSGEALAYGTVEQFLRELPCELHNLYGPTEAAIDVSYWPCSLDYPGRIVPIGKPVANTTLYIVDRHLALQPIGVPGELCIGGVQLAEGYHERDDLTERAFIGDPYSDAAGARLYRTGDLARYRSDGQIEYLGRIDNQVKLRGFRIELGEIEAVTRALPSVREAAVLVHEAGANRMLVAYVVAEDASAPFDSAGAAALMRKQLPDFMIPQLFVAIEAIPTSANGKLDRKALPDPLAGAASPAGHEPTPPTTAAEIALTRIWSEVLGNDRIGIDSNFFQLGGDSILSIRIVARLRELGYAVEVRELFAHPSVRELARHLRAAEAAGPADLPAPLALVAAEDRPLLPAGIEDAWPLSLLQSGMIYHSVLHPDSPVYHDIFSYDFSGPADAAVLSEALRRVTAQRPQLRSLFDLASYSEPLQLILASREPQVGVADLTALTQAEQDAAIAEWTEQEKRREFDLEAAPPVRFQIHLRGEQRLSLTLAFHHIVLDGWSVALVVEQIRRTYAALLDGREAPTVSERVPYSAYLALERAAIDDPRQSAYWLEQATQIGANTSIAADNRPARPQSSERRLPTALALALQGLAETIGVPLKTALLAVHLRAIAQVDALRGEGVATTGLVVNGRPELAGAEDVAGLFLNTLPLALHRDPDDAGALLRHVFAQEQEILAHRRYPLVELLRVSQREALFDNVFNYTDFRVYREEHERESVRIVGAHYFEQTNFAMVIHAHRNPFDASLGLAVNFDAARVAAETVAAYLDAWFHAASVLTGTADTATPAPVAASAHELALQQQLSDILALAIGVKQVGLDERYLELGLNSINAIRVVARLKRQGVPLSLQTLFACASVRELAANLAAAQTGGSAPVRESARIAAFELAGRARESFGADILAAYPATAMQLDMIRHHDAEPAQARYHDVFAYRFALPLDIELLRGSLQRLLDTHETLRTSFELDAAPEPLQRVHAHVPVALETTDLEALPEAARDAAFGEWFEQEKAQGFDWLQPTPMRFHAHRHDAGAFTLSLSFHHAIIDGWSLSRLIAEFVRDYSAALNRQTRPAATTVPALTYRDYVAIERESRNSDAARSLWREELRDSAFAPFPRFAGTEPAARWSETKLSLEPALQAALRDLASRAGAGLKQVLLAAHLAVIAHLQDQPDATTCVFAGGRPEEEDSEQLIGMFLNFIPFRQNLASGSWREAVAACFATEQRLLPGRRYPLADIARDHGREWIAQTAFNYTRFDAYGEIAADGAGSGQALQEVRWFEHTHFALLANAGYDLGQQRLILTLNADAREIPQSALETIAGLYAAVLTRMAADDGAPALERGDAVTEALAGLRSDA
ncbi:amino acid adenylation domain-containing protein [Pseudomonas sp. CGJS7]|uniref:amino acid adenylation domain-containing protein n=1 Tax=Pseudomonas sp. CGJS7 TaxID=3109348 RepID=UPI003008DCF8